jgi:hypothetical protein
MLMSSVASKDSASLSSNDISPEVRRGAAHIASVDNQMAATHMQWSIASLVLGVIFGGVFFFLPVPAVGPGKPDTSPIATRRIARRTLVVVGLLALICLAFVSGIALTAYFIFTHMGP